MNTKTQPTCRQSQVSSSTAKSVRRDNDRVRPPRTLCDRCSRPPAVCLCCKLPLDGPISTNTQVLILQHPAEFRRKTISTTPLISLVLSRCSIRVGYSFDAQDLAPVREALSRGQRPLLLFPGDDAISLDDETGTSSLENSIILESADTHDTFDETSRLLIILDGTWSKAKRMARDSRVLMESCQKVQFTKATESIYGAIRTQPKDHCLSTLECCAQALLLLEPDNYQVHTAVSHMKMVLQTLVDQQQQMRICPPLPREGVGIKSTRLDLKSAEGRDVFRLADGSTLRRLRHSDAPLVNNQWDRGSTRTSLEVLRRRITAGQACFGIFRGHELCGFILQYDDGVLGMLQVEDKFRRRGYASALLRKATQILQAAEVPCVTYILDGNKASEAVFSQQGWVKEDPTAKRGTGRRRAKRKWILGGAPAAAIARPPTTTRD